MSNTLAKDDGSEEGEFWYQVKLVYRQFDGIFDAYNLFSPTDQVILCFLQIQILKSDLK